MKKQHLSTKMAQYPQLLRRPLPPKQPKLPLYTRKIHTASETQPLHVKFPEDEIIPIQNISLVPHVQGGITTVSTPEMSPESTYSIFSTGCLLVSTRIFKKNVKRKRISRASHAELPKMEKTDNKFNDILILSSKFRGPSTPSITSTKHKERPSSSSEDELLMKASSIVLPSPASYKSERRWSGHSYHNVLPSNKVKLNISEFPGSLVLPTPVLPRKPQRQSIIESFLSEYEKVDSAMRICEVGSKYRRQESDIYTLRGEGFKTISATQYETVTAMANLAVVTCQVHGRNALNLKGFFLLQCPDLTSLALQLIYLNLSFNDLRQFPTEIFCLKNLQILKMRNNPIKEIPSEIQLLKFLRVFTIAFNYIHVLPYGLFSLIHLEELDISYNEITFIPNEIQKLRSLEKLNINGNYLFYLPLGILKLNLTKIHFDNTFTHRILWAENSLNSPQRLTHICSLFIIRNNIYSLYDVIPLKSQKLLKFSSRCEWCLGPKFGEGLRVIRSYDIFGATELPVMFHVCSSSCYKKVKDSSFIWESLPYQRTGSN